MTDTRKDKRAPVSLKVRFKSATVDEFIEQYARDISHGGLFIKSKQPMAIGTLLKFEFQLKDESKLIQGVGRVVWKREAADAGGEDKPAGMGIKFIKMDPESRTLVDQIVDGRGSGPGQYEAGAPAGALAAADPDEAPAETTAGAKPARPVRSQKATMQFFPSTTPQSELPAPEDRTQVRHASEFLASALASGGADDLASKEADKKAEEARKRSEEIEAAREKQAKEAKEAKDAEERAQKERAERERADEEKRAAAEKQAAEDERKSAATAATIKAEEPAKKAESVRPPKKADSERPPAKAAEKKAEAKPAEKKAEPKAAEKKPAAAVAVPASSPARDGGSNLVPIIAGVLVMGGVGVWFFLGGSGASTATTPTTAATPPTTAATPPVEPPDEPPVEPTADPAVDPAADPAVDPTVVAVPDEPPPPPAPTFEVRVETTPAGASILVGGVEMGTSPATISLPEGAQTIVAHLAGYREGTSEITVAEGARPVRITLAALPYAVEVTTEPAGARVRVGASRTLTAPGRVEITRPSRAMTITASLTGYLDATTTIEPTGFTETADAMLATVTLTLAPRPVTAPVVRTGSSGGSTSGGRASSGGTTGGSSGGDTTGGSSGGEATGGSSGGAEPSGSSGGAEPSGSSGGSAGGSSGGAEPSGSGSSGGSSGGSSSGGSSGGSSSSGGEAGGSSGGAAEAPPDNPF